MALLLLTIFLCMFSLSSAGGLYVPNLQYAIVLQKKCSAQVLSVERPHNLFSVHGGNPACEAEKAGFVP
jgi:hypothetical protein